MSIASKSTIPYQGSLHHVRAKLWQAAYGSALL